MIGDALVHENPRLQARINQLLDRIEATLKQSLKIAVGARRAAGRARLSAPMPTCWSATLLGRWQRFVKSGFKDDPLARWPAQWPLLAG